jgi:hypothetical protein
MARLTADPKHEWNYFSQNQILGKVFQQHFRPAAPNSVGIATFVPEHPSRSPDLAACLDHF